MKGEENLARLVNGMNPVLNEGEYVFVSVSSLNEIDRDITLCEFKEKEGITVIIERARADELNLSYEYTASWITLEIHSSLAATGLTAIFSAELAKNNISCNVIAGYYHDHIFVDKRDSERTVEVLKALAGKYNSK